MKRGRGDEPYPVGRSSTASDPGRFPLSMSMLRWLAPERYERTGANAALQVRKMEDYVGEQLDVGDSRAAVVVSENPCLIAAYSDDFDGVLMLRYEDRVRERFGLELGARLVAVFFYRLGKRPDSDIIVGPASTNMFSGCHPVIADLLTNDVTRLLERKEAISEREWLRAESLGREYLRRFPGVARDGTPMKAERPAGFRPERSKSSRDD